MDEGEKKPDAGTLSGSPQKKIVYAVLAVAVVILAVVLIAKFGYNTDLLNPAGGQMSLVQRQPVAVKVAVITTAVTTTVTPTTEQPLRGMTVAPAYAKATLNPVSLSHCTPEQTYCTGTCADLQTDPNNCGACGHVCSQAYQVVNFGCSNSQCKTLLCEAYYSDDDGNYENGCEHYWGPGTPNNPMGLNGPLGPSSSTTSSGDVGDDYDTSDNGCNVYGAADCDGNPSNGCEAQTYGDINNCGKCGQKCTAPANTVGTMCSNFKCTNQPGSVLSCKAGWGNCDGTYSNGCENDLRSNSDCGTCGHWCGFPEHCFWDPNYPTLNHCGI
jgi:hypothetical protein